MICILDRGRALYPDNVGRLARRPVANMNDIHEKPDEAQKPCRVAIICTFRIPVFQVVSMIDRTARLQALQQALKERILIRSEEHTSELQSRENLVCRLLLEKKKKNI